MKLTDAVNRITGNVYRFTTDLEYYVGGEHFDSSALSITRKGLIKPNLNVLGFKFHFAFQNGDVLFMARNPHLKKAGMVMFSGLCSDASYILRTKDNDVLDQKYLAVLLQTDHFWDYCVSHKVGSVHSAINWTTLANYEFDLPPIEEQRVLADKLWAAYNLKEAYKKMITATDVMVKSQFIEMFGNPNNNENGIKFDSLFYDDTKSAMKITASEYRSNGEYAIYDQGQDNDICGYSNDNKGVCYNYPALLFGDHSRVIKLIDRPFLIGADGVKIIRIKESKLKIEFAYYMLKYSNIPHTGYNRHLKYLKLKRFFEPNIQAQNSFVKIIKQADKSKFELNQAIDKIDKVIKSLLQ